MGKNKNLSTNDLSAMADRLKKQRVPGRTATGQQPNQIITEPTEEDLQEVFLIFGRMNPPTIGHSRLVEHAKDLAGDSDVKLFLSHTVNESNPLKYNEKVLLCKLAFGDIVQESDAKDIFQVLKELDGFYDKVTILCGSDRIDEWQERIPQYNGSEFNFKSIDFVSMDRSGDELNEQASATSIREKIKEGDESFIKLIPENLRFKAAIDLIVEKTRADYSMVQTTAPDGTQIWRKQKHMLGKDKKEQPYNLAVNEGRHTDASDILKKRRLREDTKRIDWLRKKTRTKFAKFKTPDKYKKTEINSTDDDG